MPQSTEAIGRNVTMTGEYCDFLTKLSVFSGRLAGGIEEFSESCPLLI